MYQNDYFHPWCQDSRWLPGAACHMYENTMCMCVYMMICIYMFVACMYIVHTCLCMVHFCSSWFTSVCTRVNQLQTMLWYRNWPFGTDSVQTRIYTLKTALAGGKLSCGISHYTVQTLLNSVQTSLYSVQPLTDTILKK